MKQGSIAIFFIFLFLIPVTLFAQPKWTNFISDDEPNKVIYNENFVWFAHHGGLTRIDRQTNRSTIFHAGNSGLIDNDIEEIELSPDGTLYALSDRKILKFENEDFHLLNHQLNGIEMRFFTNFKFDAAGNLYSKAEPDNTNHNSHGISILQIDENEILTEIAHPSDFDIYFGLLLAPFDENDIYAAVSDSEGGLAHLKNDTITIYDATNSPLLPKRLDILLKTPEDKILMVQEDDSNTYWVFIFDGENWEAFNTDDFPITENSYIKSSFFDANGNFWLSLNGGQKFQFNGETVEMVVNPTMPGIDLPENGILYNITEDGHWWVHRDNYEPNRLYEFDGESYWQHQTSNANYKSQNIYDLQVDEKGNVWVTNEGTLAKYDGFKWTNFAEAWKDLPFRPRSVRFDQNGEMWLSLFAGQSNGQTLAHANGANWDFYSLGVDSDGNPLFFYDFLFDADNNLWGVYESGIARYDGSNWTYYNIPGGGYFSSQILRNHIYLTEDNTLYVFHFDGLYQFNGNNFEYVPVPPGTINPDWIIWLFEDQDHNLWIKTYDQLLVYDGTTFVEFIDNIPINYVGLSGMTQDKNGVYWFATCDGYLRYDLNNWEHLTYGTTGFCQRGIMIDSFNNIWSRPDDYLGHGIIIYNENGINKIGTSGNCLSGSVFLDINENGEKESTEPMMMNQKLQLLPDETIYFTSIIGNYQIPVPANIPKTVKVLPDTDVFHVTTDSASYTAAVEFGCLEDLDFGLAANNSEVSGEIHLTPGIPRCSNMSVLWGSIHNTSYFPYNGLVSVTVDELIEVVSVTPMPDDIVGNIYTWEVDDFLPLSFFNFNFELLYPGVNAIGETVNFHGQFLNESEQVLDSTTVHQIVICSYDPNDKSAQSTGESVEEYSLLEDALEYLIRFENKGNDTAFSVVVVDTLSTHLDINSFEILGASHPVEVKIDNRVVQFTFHPIFLPYTDIDPVGSQGFIKYRIRPNANIPDPTIINNTAYIYFDFNPAIVTNTTENILVETLPIINAISQTHSNRNCIFDFAPNPFDNKTQALIPSIYANGIFRVFDVTGRLVFIKKLNNQTAIQFNKNGLPSGLYFYQIMNEQESCGGRFLMR